MADATSHLDQGAPTSYLQKLMSVLRQAVEGRWFGVSRMRSKSQTSKPILKGRVKPSPFKAVMTGVSRSLDPAPNVRSRKVYSVGLDLSGLAALKVRAFQKKLTHKIVVTLDDNQKAALLADYMSKDSSKTQKAEIVVSSKNVGKTGNGFSARRHA